MGGYLLTCVSVQNAIYIQINDSIMYYYVPTYRNCFLVETNGTVSVIEVGII